jgi:hypothetical protein
MGNIHRFRVLGFLKPLKPSKDKRLYCYAPAPPGHPRAGLPGRTEGSDHGRHTLGGAGGHRARGGEARTGPPGAGAGRRGGSAGGPGGAGRQGRSAGGRGRGGRFVPGHRGGSVKRRGVSHPRALVEQPGPPQVEQRGGSPRRPEWARASGPWPSIGKRKSYAPPVKPQRP